MAGLDDPGPPPSIRWKLGTVHNNMQTKKRQSFRAVIGHTSGFGISPRWYHFKQDLTIEHSSLPLTLFVLI